MELLYADDLPRLMDLVAEAATLVDRLGALDGDPEVAVFWLGASTNVQLFPDFPSDLDRLGADLEHVAARADGAVRNQHLLNMSGFLTYVGDRSATLRALDELTAVSASLGPFQRAQLAGWRSSYAARHGSPRLAR